MRTVLAALLCVLAPLSAMADPIVYFGGTVVPVLQSQSPESIHGINASVGNTVSGTFDLGGGPFAVTINSATFTVLAPAVARIVGDQVVGINFSVWGDLQGIDARMQIIFHANQSQQFVGCGACPVDLPSANLLSYKWDFVKLWIRNSYPVAPIGIQAGLPCLADCYPTAYFPNPIYLDAEISSLSSIPEPSSLLLLGSGMAAIFMCQRKKAGRRSAVRILAL